MKFKLLWSNNKKETKEKEVVELRNQASFALEGQELERSQFMFQELTRSLIPLCKNSFSFLNLFGNYCRNYFHVSFGFIDDESDTSCKRRANTRQVRWCERKRRSEKRTGATRWLFEKPVQIRRTCRQLSKGHSHDWTSGMWYVLLQLFVLLEVTPRNQKK